MNNFLSESKYVDFSSDIIKEKAFELFEDTKNDIEKAEKAFLFVRDEIFHIFDIKQNIVTTKASEVLRLKAGICHTKSILLAAFLRSCGIPTGFCFQRITLADDDSIGYCVHCYNAVFLNEKWVKLDARGNKPGMNVQFSLTVPKLAYENRKEYDEYFWQGIYAYPHKETMEMLEKADSLDYILKNIPDFVNQKPDVY